MAGNKSSLRMGDKERKIGHRRVGVGGEITYKKIQTSQIMGSIQLGTVFVFIFVKNSIGVDFRSRVRPRPNRIR